MIAVCELTGGTILLCGSTYYVIDSYERRPFSQEAYQAYGSPAADVWDDEGCPTYYGCWEGEPMPASVSELDWTGPLGNEEGERQQCATLWDIACCNPCACIVLFGDQAAPCQVQPQGSTTNL